MREKDVVQRGFSVPKENSLWTAENHGKILELVGFQGRQNA